MGHKIFHCIDICGGQARPRWTRHTLYPVGFSTSIVLHRCHRVLRKCHQFMDSSAYGLIELLLKYRKLTGSVNSLTSLYATSLSPFESILINIYIYIYITFCLYTFEGLSLIGSPRVDLGTKLISFSMDHMCLRATPLMPLAF